MSSTQTYLPEMGGKTDVISSGAITLTVHANYASGDFVGTSATPITFAKVALHDGGSGTIMSAVLTDYAVQSVAMELWLFDTTITPPADSAAWTITDAEAATCIGVIPFSTYYASAANSVSYVANVGLPFKCGASADDIYGALVTRGAPSYASGDLTVRLFIFQD